MIQMADIGRRHVSRSVPAIAIAIHTTDNGATAAEKA
jgi:hypothetical protein